MPNENKPELSILFVPSVDGEPVGAEDVTISIISTSVGRGDGSAVALSMACDSA